MFFLFLPYHRHVLSVTFIIKTNLFRVHDYILPSFKENSKVEVEKDKLKTHEKTMNLLKEGMSIKEVANERELTISTIISHISKCISEGNLIDLDINFDELFTKEEEKLILEAADKVGMEKIGPIKSLLPNEITYDKINAVILNKKRCLMI